MITLFICFLWCFHLIRESEATWLLCFCARKLASCLCTGRERVKEEEETASGRKVQRAKQCCRKKAKRREKQKHYMCTQTWIRFCGYRFIPWQQVFFPNAYSKSYVPLREEEEEKEAKPSNNEKNTHQLNESILKVSFFSSFVEQIFIIENFSKKIFAFLRSVWYTEQSVARCDRCLHMLCIQTSKKKHNNFFFVPDF